MPEIGERVLRKEYGKGWPEGGIVRERWVDGDGTPMMAIEKLCVGPRLFNVREQDFHGYATAINQQPENTDASSQHEETSTQEGIRP